MMNQHMSQYIQKITEAYSMQPDTQWVGKEFYNYDNQSDEMICARIVEEEVYINGDPYTFYVGYDGKGRRLFEFKKGTVNVFYGHADNLV